MTPVAHALHFPERPKFPLSARSKAHRAKHDYSKPPYCLFLLAEKWGRMIATGEVDPLTGSMDYQRAVAGLTDICLVDWRVTSTRIDKFLPLLVNALCQAAERDELQAAQDIRVGLQPLLHRRAPTQTLRAEAYRLSAARLLRPDCDAIVQQEIAKALNASRARQHERA